MKKLGIFLVILLTLVLPFSALIYRIFRYSIHSWGSKNLLFLSGTGLDLLLPDSYSCFDGCNRCSGKVIKIGLFYFTNHGLCTLKSCIPNFSEELYSRDWMYFYLTYDTYT